MEEIKQENFLPIGTVVKLKDEEKRVMIIGFCAMSAETKKIYNYLACLYPEGIIDSKDLIMFNDYKIEKIFYKGFIDEDEKKFESKLINLSNTLSKIEKSAEISKKE